MSVPSMVHRSGGNLIVRSVVSGDALYEQAAGVGDVAATRPARVVDDGDDDDDDRSKELPDCKVRRNYTCPSCDFFTQNPRLYLYHLRDVHNEKIRVYECPHCLYASKHFQKLLRHSKMVHGTSEGVSAAETSRKSRKRSFHEEEDEDDEQQQQQQQQQQQRHLPQDHPSDENGFEEGTMASEDPVLFKCSVCAFTSRNRVQLNKHEREEHIKTKFFRCSKCTYVTHIKARYTKHVKYHSMPMIKCDMCDFRTPYKWNLDRHCKNHNGKGAFHCSACNFTADIKQSLTVHEMNHHVPPVGQAAGLGVGRRRNKVGASDTTAAEEAAAAAAASVAAPAGHEPHQVSQQREPEPEPEPARPPPAASPKEDAAVKSKAKIKVTPKRARASPGRSNAHAPANEHQPSPGRLSDFIHPDDIIHHANGKVYIKNKCKLCNFKTAWDGEMAKHERKFHDVHRVVTEKKHVAAKKTPRPVPNLIPIPASGAAKQQRPSPTTIRAAEPAMSQKDINDICSRSANSALKDFASLFGSEDVFANPSTSKVPDLIPTSIFSSTSRTNNAADFKQKNASFFDRLKEKLELGTTGCNLTCNLCGHESKCLTEQAKHQKICGKEISKVPYSAIPVHNISASRCQYCRQRCKSSADLYNHLQTCAEALKVHGEELKQEEDTGSEHENELKIDEDRRSVGEEEHEIRPHPMENKVFVWNDIMVPMDIEVDDSNYEYTEDKVDDNVSLDLSIRTQSPTCSENSYAGQENNNNINTNNNLPAGVQHSPVQATEKIPTHGNDISVAQHKRVFKCPHCTFWASTASRFHVHIVGHLNKKPFECSLCSYRSNWRWDITKHIKLKSVRDQAHESAKVLMTDETGRRNYTKYNKYLTEIPLSSLQSSTETSGGSGTRPRNHDRTCSPSTSKSDRMGKVTGGGELTSLLKVSNLRPPPALKAADKHFLASVSQEKKRSNSDNKRTLFKCKKCNFRDASRDVLLQHVKGHYQQQQQQQQQRDQQEQLFRQAAAAGHLTVAAASLVAPAAGAGTSAGAIFSAQDISLRGTSPDRDERHCRLKHSGDIRVVSTKNGQEKIEIEEQPDEPDHTDLPQCGEYKCNVCPYATNNQDEFQFHLPGHMPQSENAFRCTFCKFGVSQELDLIDHLKLHGVCDPNEFLKANDSEGKKFRCVVCPYVTNSKSQYTYHKQFHKARGGQYTCTHCSYNVSKRHLLHQHLKVHGIQVSPSKHNGEATETDEMNDEIEEVLPSYSVCFDSSQFPDIPLVWVSKNGKFSKMFKCRFCPHVNLRKVNIQEHEKMHSTREKNPNSTRTNDVEHRCTECNYICNNAGVLSSHSKVHQGLYGTVHCLADSTKSDEEQIKELSRVFGSTMDGIDTSEFLEVEMEEIDTSPDSVLLYFCQDCPARFLKENEYVIHRKFHHNSWLQFKCDFCSYAADNNSYLLSHLKVHTVEYQERTRTLKDCNITSPNHLQPDVKQMKGPNGELVWGICDNNDKTDGEREHTILASFLNKPLKSSQRVPLSGTDLFEKRQKHSAEITGQEDINSAPPNKSPDPQFGHFMHGNPEFIYQTYIKNGRTKEKRYKCHKCPSAFEKREQYKVHLGLHGSNQRYNCEFCDYSVKYYANYVQHKKKHKFNDEAQAARKSSDGNNEESDEIDESNEVTTEVSPEECDDGPLKLSVADQQMLMIMQHRISGAASAAVEEKKSYWCPSCPYVSGRRDAVENHQKRHANMSGARSAYACEHCDYSVPQAHFLRDHTKLHFMPNKVNHVHGYMLCDNLKLTSNSLEASTGNNDNNENVIFEEEVRDRSEGTTFLPPLSADVEEKFNNNNGEKQLINVQTGDVVVKKDDVSDSNVKSNNCQMEVN